MLLVTRFGKSPEFLDVGITRRIKRVVILRLSAVLMVRPVVLVDIILQMVGLIPVEIIENG